MNQKTARLINLVSSKYSPGASTPLKRYWKSLTHKQRARFRKKLVRDLHS